MLTGHPWMIILQVFVSSHICRPKMDTALLKHLVVSIQDAQYGQYFTIAGFTVIIYDSVLTYPEERRVIWLKPWSITKVLYIINRYGMSLLILYFLAVIIPLIDFNTHSCQSSAVAIIVINLVTVTAGNAIVLNQLVRLWGSSGTMTILMASAFVILHLITVGFAVVAANSLRTTIFSLKDATLVIPIRGCSTNQEQHALIGVYAPILALDIYSFGLLFGNALSRPRTENEKLLSILYGDGMVFFLISSTMHALNLVISSVAPPSMVVLSLNFGDTMVSNAVARLYLQLCRDPIEDSDFSDHDVTELQPLSGIVTRSVFG